MMTEGARSLPAVSPRVLRVGFAAGLWAAIAAPAWVVLGRHEDGVAGGIASLLNAVEGHPSAPLLLLLAFVIRPVTLLPVTVLTAFSGFLLGPVLGFVVASLAVVATALIPYGFARLARGTAPSRNDARGLSALSARPFESVLAARLAMIPGDLVNMAAGLMRVPVPSFVAASVVGGTPGMLVSILAGASLQGTFRVDGSAVGWPLVAASGAMLGVSMMISGALRRRMREAEAAAE